MFRSSTQHQPTTVTDRAQQQQQHYGRTGAAAAGRTSTNEYERDSVVQIGLIATYQAANVILGAIPEAVAAVNARKDLLPGHVLAYTSADVGTSKASEVTKIRK